MIVIDVLALAKSAVLAAIPAVGFALLFNVPQKLLKHCAMLGAVGVSSRLLLMHNGLSFELGTLLAATLVGSIGIWLSPRVVAPPKAMTVASVIPMLPGVYAFKSMTALVQLNQTDFSPELLAVLFDNFLTTMFVIGGLALGLALPGLLFYRNKRIV
ncbi:threonine/serine exporter family protein [uncultured Ferrimonas sp.]|uniref:threonine/serine exporter family protein n=1 Tax=uncultured Ferrimonas sp. TaxID=432640 RepID=UPI002613DDC6|nr:threonine/serine exporter family protein [uncultured Ferrimonas sp.]